MLKYLGTKCHYVCKLLSEGSAREREREGKRMYNMLTIIDEEYRGVHCSYNFNPPVDLKFFYYKNGKY